MTTIELNNRKYSLISEIMNIDSEAIIDKIEKIIKKESHPKSPLSFTVEELKQEIIEAEKETISHSHDDVKAMSWKQ
jgi:low affinity Fe/Cu permease